jgi:hypothetical protein
VVTTTLPVAGKDVQYSATLEAKGGAAPYRWVVVGGGLPPGFMLDPDTGAITGKTSQVGAYFATFCLTDAGPAASVRQTLGITVLKKLPPPPPQ